MCELHLTKIIFGFTFSARFIHKSVQLFCCGRAVGVGCESVWLHYAAYSCCANQANKPHIDELRLCLLPSLAAVRARGVGVVF